MNHPDFTAKNTPKIAEAKLSSCGLKVADSKKNCDCGIAVAEQHFFKRCGIAITEVLPSSCGIAIAVSKKSCACPPLHNTQEPAISLHSYTVPLVQWSTRLLLIIRDPGSIPRDTCVKLGSPVSVVSLQHID
jgi:hypothetical protein